METAKIIRENTKKYRKDVKRQISNPDLHIRNFNLSDRELIYRITSKRLSFSSTFITDNEELVLSAAADAIKKSQDELLWFLSFPESMWDTGFRRQNGALFYISFDLPKDVTGHLFKRAHEHNWNGGAITCHERGVLVIARNMQYAKEMSEKGESEEDPFTVLTAYPVED